MRIPSLGSVLVAILVAPAAGYGFSFDNFTVERVLEPCVLLLLGAGLIGLFRCDRRNRVRTSRSFPEGEINA